MPIQILGIFDSVFNWVYDKLFSPVISWLSTILGNVFTWIFENILQGFLLDVFEILWDHVLVYIAGFLFRWIYELFCALLTLLDCLQSCFDVLIGMRDIYYGPNNEHTTLLNYILFNDTTRNALIAVTIIAVVLTVIFSIYSVVHSSLDLDGENKRPVGKVLSMTVKSLLTFLFIPAICWVGINLAGILLKSTAAAIQGGGDNFSVSRMILAIASCNASKKDVAFSLTVNPWKDLMNGTTNYLQFALLDTGVHIAEIDYLIGYSSVIFCTIIMLLCLFTFIKRIYDIVMLYIVSPYFASSMVLDDGRKFSQWRSTFIGKIVLGFGSAIGMRLFLILVPVIMDERMTFFTTDNLTGAVKNLTAGYLLKLLFILGGMYAVLKSAGMLTSIVNSSVGAQEQKEFDDSLKGLQKSVIAKARGMRGRKAPPAKGPGGAVLQGAMGGARGGSGGAFGGPGSGAFGGPGGPGGGGDYSLDGVGKKSLAADEVPDSSEDLQRLFGEMDYQTDLSDHLKDDYVQPSDMVNIDGETGATAASGDVLGGVDTLGDYAPIPDAMAESDAASKPESDAFSKPDAEAVKQPDISVDGEEQPLDDKKGAEEAANRDIFSGVDIQDDYVQNPEEFHADDDVYSADSFEDDDEDLAVQRQNALRDSMQRDGNALAKQPDSQLLPNGPLTEEREQKEQAINVPLTDFARKDYTRTHNRGISRVGVGNKVFDIPKGYTAFPKLVKDTRVKDRIQSMKQNAEPRFSAYYDAMANSTNGINGYSVPRVRGGDLGYGSFTRVNGVQLNVPSGYTVVPEIMKIDDAQNIAGSYGGSNAAFYKEYTSNLSSTEISQSPLIEPPKPKEKASTADIAELEAGVFGASGSTVSSNISSDIGSDIGGTFSSNKNNDINDANKNSDINNGSTTANK